MRLCKKCGIEKPFSEFSKASAKPGGISYRCRLCNAENAREWRINNEERFKQTLRNNYLNNRENRLQKAKDWREANRDVKRDYNRNRKLKLKDSTIGCFTESDIIELYGTSCHLCGFAIDMKAPRQSGKPGWQNGLHIDHVVPVSRGGKNTIENVRPSHGLCNLKKNNRMV